MGILTKGTPVFLPQKTCNKRAVPKMSKNIGENREKWNALCQKNSQK